MVSNNPEVRIRGPGADPVTLGIFSSILVLVLVQGYPDSIAMHRCTATCYLK